MTYENKTHVYGKIWTWTAVVMVLMVPLLICIYYNSFPEFTDLAKGFIGVAPIFWSVGLIEVLTYTPMLGTGGSYMAFVTGNLTGIKVPAALNAMENMEVKAGTDEGEVISTIAVSVSAIVTTLVIALGVLFLSFLTPIINSPTLSPAFENILPALFGGLAVVFISKNWKIAVAPLVFMIMLFLLVPSLASSVGILVPVGAGIAILVARVLYKKHKL